MKKWLKRLVIWGSIAFTSLVFVGYLIFVIVYNVNKTTEPINETPVETISASAVYNLVNEKRVNAAVQPMSNNPQATEAAEKKCAEMDEQDYYDHVNPKTGQHGDKYAMDTIPDGILFSENMTESIFINNAEVVQAWMDSPDHKANMLEPKWTDTGIAVCHRHSQPEGSFTVVEEFVQIAN